MSIALLCGWLLTPHGTNGAPVSTGRGNPLSPRQATEALQTFPLTFEPNFGQTDPQVRFLTRAMGMTSFLTGRQNVMVLSRRKHRSDPATQTEASDVEETVVRLKMVGANLPMRFEPLEKVGSISNYFLGNNPSKWTTNVPHYRKLRARGVYPGIDLVYYGDGRKLEYDFVVHPGADPAFIRLGYEGAGRLTIDSQGNLLIATQLGTLVQHKPKVYQEFKGRRRPVEASYAIRRGKVAFALANWDRQQELVIDPSLEYSTYFGGSGNDYGNSLATDSAGAAYVVGYTNSTDFPLTAAFQPAYGGAQDVFVTKINPAGNGVVYSTYLGGSGNDYGYSIQVDTQGQAYLTGSTTSANFPVTPGAFQTTIVDTGPQAPYVHGFVTKLNAAGNSLVYSTYLAGTGTGNAADVPAGIAIDAVGNAYVGGYTGSADFPTTPGVLQPDYVGGLRHIFVTKLNATGTALIYSTFVGGPNADYANSIAVDASGHAYVTGYSNSCAFTLQNPIQDTCGGKGQNMIVAKLNPTGTALEYATFVGFGTATGRNIAVTPTGEAYVTGFTQNDGPFPITPGALQPTFGGGTKDAYVLKLNSTGTAFDYSTYLGGAGDDQGQWITVDAAGAAYLTGFTSSANFATTACAFQTAFGGLNDAFIVKLTPSGTLAYSTYLGGSGSDNGGGIALDGNGKAYVTGNTNSLDFPTTAGAPQSGNAGGIDAFVTKLSLISAGPAATITATSGTPQVTAVGTPFQVPLQARVTDAAGSPVAGVVVTFTVPTSGASASLSALSATTDCSGLASVTATANLVAGTFTVSAAANTVTPANFTLTNTAGEPQTIAFVQQPTDTTAGSTIAPVVVLLEDAQNHPIAGANVVIAIEGGAAPLHGTLTRITDSAGHATFNDLSSTVTGTYNLQASTAGLATLSNSFRITAGSAISIAVSAGYGQAADVGTTFAAPLEAIVHDAYNNPVPGAPVPFSAPASGASATFAGASTVNTDVNGIAISPAITANSQTGSFQVTAITTGAPSAAIFTLTNVAATANRLAFVQQPADTTAGATISPPVTVQLQDSQGNAVHTLGIPVTLQLVPAQPLSGTLTQATDGNGLATFTNLSVQHVGQYELLAEAASIVSVTSHLFNIATGSPAAILASAGTPQSTVIHTIFGVPLQVTVTDAVGNPGIGVSVVFAAPASGPSGLFGVQSTMTVTTDQNGHASAVITANGIAGSYQVTASTTAITGSAVFLLTNLPVGSSALAFVQQPSNTTAGQVISPAVGVRVQDASGQPVSEEGVPIILSLSSGTGTLLGTLVQLTDATGVATFPDLRIADAGTKRLRAISIQQIPAESNTFQIAAGAAASITAFSGSPQLVLVSHQFPLALQAQVKDSSGNPVSGVMVTFSAPSSGPSGTFAGGVTVATDSNGIATAPPLTANSLAGSFTVTASPAGVNSTAAFALTNLPSVVPQASTIVVDLTQLIFTSEINLPAPVGQVVQVTSAAGGTVSWTATASAPWLGVLPAAGSTPGQITVTVNPAGLAVGTYTGSIRITAADGSVTSVLVTYTITGKPALVVTPHTLVFTTSSSTVTPAAQSLSVTSTSRAIAYNISTQVSSPSGGAWLQVSPTEGHTAGTVTVSVNPSGLPQGIYDGAVVFTAVENGLNSVAVPVTLLVGCAEGGCLPSPNIISVVNGASFHPGGAPGAAMTIFGTNLSDAIYQATSFPLPTGLGPTTVTVNGVAAPLYYVSPTQINFQMPYGVPSAAVSVVVTNQALTSTRALHASLPHISTLGAVDPGLFLTTGRRAAALNVDLTPHTPATPIAAGGYVLLFLTGQGPVTPPIAEGVAATTSPLSLIDGTVQVSIGGLSAKVTYQGLAPGFAGLAQLNVIVPTGLTPGDQPVFVSINGVPSNAGLITVK